MVKVLILISIFALLSWNLIILSGAIFIWIIAVILSIMSCDT